VIDSCIEVIIGLPDIRVHRLIHRIPSYFDTPDPNYFELNTNMNGTTSTVRAATRPLSLIRADVVRTATNEYIDNEYIDNTRKVTANPEKTELGLDEVEYVGHLISSTGTSFTDEKRLQVLDFPLPETEKALLQFIGLVNYFRDHVPHIVEMVQPLRKLIDMKKYKGSKKLTWTPESKEAFHFCRIAVSKSFTT
jgi:hypothetical protein